MNDFQTTEKSPEWALRRSMDIAARYIDHNVDDEQQWRRWAALAHEIAEALYEVATPLKGGKRAGQ